MHELSYEARVCTGNPTRIKKILLDDGTDNKRRCGMITAAAEKSAGARREAIYVGLPAPGEIGRMEILEALRRAGERSARIRREAAAAVRRQSACRDRSFE